MPGFFVYAGKSLCAPTVEYNHLNLPQKVTYSNGNWVEWTYDATGQKLKKTTSAGDTKHYINGIEYDGTVIEAIYHAEGRASLQGSTYRYEYTLRDHLGNSRVMFADLNSDNEVDETEILQQNHYYPFGMNIEGSWGMGTNKYQYNGKEIDNDFGLDWYHYGFRMYDAAIGRFTGVDPMAEKYLGWSPYNYVLGNPIRNIDPQGDTVRVAVGNEFINYTPGMEYTGDNKFAQGVINSLNTMNTSEAGAEVLGSLVASENNYSFVNVVSTDKNGNPVDGVRFRRGENGGGTIEAGASNDVGTIAHELFHGYQIESGMNPATTAGEVGAYLFQDVVTLQAGVPFGSSASTNEYGMKYDAAHSNLLYNGFNDADYISANIFFKFSSKNATGLYNKTKRTISTFPKPPIAEFLPAFK